MVNDKGVRIPVRVKPARNGNAGQPTDRARVAESNLPLKQEVTEEPGAVRPEPEMQGVAPRAESAAHAAPQEEEELLELDGEAWRERAMRLQAEMENFRKRQQRLAEERIAADRERLLRAFLRVADDLQRALSADGTDAESLRQGINLTHQSMMQLMNREGAEPIQAKGEPFDPTWHEAVGTVPHEQARVEPDTVVEVVQEGYRLGDRLLRPARVVVAT